MLSTYQLKTRFQSLLRPLAAWLYRAGVTANLITVGACLVSVALGVTAMVDPQNKGWFLLIAVWCLLRMAANALDGMLARDFGQASKLGAVLNEFGDLISDIALYLPFAFLAGSNPWLVVTIVLLALLTEVAGLLAVLMASERRYDGPMGKSDRAVVFGVTGLLIGLGFELHAFLNWIWTAVIALLALTIIHRLKRALANSLQR